MRITGLRTAETKHFIHSLYIRLETDEGLIGNGECVHGGTGYAAVAHDLAPLLIGEDPRNVEMIWEKIRRARIFDGALAGITVSVLSGIEIALWDLAGKALGLPAYQLLGGTFRDTIRLYCDSHAGRDFAPESYAERARAVVALGFDAIKFDVDETQAGHRTDRWNWHASPQEIAWMVERVAAVRDAIGPQIDLAIDMHGKYDTSSGIRVAQALAPFNLLWLEDPVPPENIAAMREVKLHSPVPICTGENLYLRWGFRDLIEREATDIVSPDVPKCGGMSEARKIANIAEVYYMQFAPHNVGGPLSTMASAHVCASVPNFLAMEWHWVDRAEWDQLTFGEMPLIQNGALALTDRPGIGVEINDEQLRKYMVPGTTFYEVHP